MPYDFAGKEQMRGGGESRPLPPGPIPGTKPEAEESDGGGEKAAMYHGPEQHCEACQHFQQPSACAVAVREGWSNAQSIDPGGWCKNFAEGAGDSDMDDEDDF